MFVHYWNAINRIHQWRVLLYSCWPEEIMKDMGKSRGPSVHMRAPIAIKLVVLEALNWGHGTSHIVIQTALKPSHEPSEHLVKLR